MTVPVLPRGFALLQVPNEPRRGRPISRLSPAQGKLGPRSYYKVVSGRVVEHSVGQDFVFFDVADAGAAQLAFVEASALAAAALGGATICVWARTPGVPAHVPVIGEFQEGGVLS